MKPLLCLSRDFFLYCGFFFSSLCSMPTQSHSLSTGFGELQPGLSLTLQLALSDLQLALQWPTHRDLTWSMVKSQHQPIQHYLQQRLLNYDAARQPLACVWQSDPTQWQLTLIQQQYYLQLNLKTDCQHSRWLHYQLFSELHEHKALIKTPQGEQVLSEANPWLAL